METNCTWKNEYPNLYKAVLEAEHQAKLQERLFGRTPYTSYLADNWEDIPDGVFA